MTAIVLDNDVRVPESVIDLASFRQWALSPEYPERGRFSYLDGELWIDMSPVRLFSHSALQGEINAVLTLLIRRSRAGTYFPDRALLTNEQAGLSTEPDGTFVSWKSLKDGRVELREKEDDYLEIIGSPDMVLEVVSPTSVKKDKVVLSQLYRRAEIREFWLVDARGERLEFQLAVLGPKGYAPAKKQDGWQRSPVFGKWFRLTRRWNKHGFPEYTLAVR